MPQVKGVFGCKSLDDVIPGSWYIIPLPSNIEVVIGYHSFWKFLSCENFGAIVCLSVVLSVFILTLLLQGSVFDGRSVDHDEELMNRVFVRTEFSLA